MDPHPHSRASRPSLIERLTARTGERAWHSEFREEVTSLFRRPANQNRHPLVPVRNASIAAALLLSIPLTTWIGAHLLFAREESRIAALEAKPAVRLALAAQQRRVALGRPEVARLFAHPTVSDVAERLALALPRDAAIHGLGVDENGALMVEVELPDPDRLRGALAGDPLLRSLRQVSQTNGISGPRVSLFAAAARSKAAPERATPHGGVFDRLRAARRERVRREALNRAAPAAPLAGALVAQDREHAVASLIGRLRRAAVRTGTLIETAEADETVKGAPVALVRIAVSAPEKALLSFVGEMENGTPLMRFASWRVEPSEGAMRLEGRVAAIWEPGR